ncbi:MAG: hypothetical protein HYV09_27280 [Deltaproteobacteria bacterium]|nr:hypothetical protein [Deltaproteobacteria bacterium]
MNASSTPFVALLLASSIALSSVAAHAEPTKADIASAKVAIKEARALRDKGDHASALPKFKAAYALVPTPLTGLELGKAHLSVGELIEARLTFSEVVAMPVGANENDEYRAARVESKELATKLLDRIPSLHLVIKGVPPGVTPRVTIDGQEIPYASLAAPRLLNPGKHVVRVTAGDAPERVVNLVLVEGQAKEHSIIIKPKPSEAPDEPPAVEPAPAPKASPASKDDARATSDGSTQRTLGLVIGGLGVGAVLAGGFFYVSGNSKYETATSRCVGDRCSKDDYLAAEDGRNQARLGMWVAAAGAVAVGAGLVVWLTAPSGKPRTAVAVSPTTVTFSYAF